MVKLKVYLQIKNKPQCHIKKKSKYKFYNSFTEGIIDLIKMLFQRLKITHYPSMIFATTQYDRATYCLEVKTSLNVDSCILLEISLTED